MSIMPDMKAGLNKYAHHFIITNDLFAFLDYNPLMGNSGGSSRYRPDRRTTGGGG